jgi:hypothetical protein
MTALELAEVSADCTLHHKYLVSMNLALALIEQNKLADSQTILAKCGDYLYDNKLAGTGDHVIWLHAVSRLYLGQVGVGGTRRAAESALEMSRRLLGESHIRTASCLETMADVEMSEGHVIASSKLLKQAAEIRSRLLADSSPLIAQTLAKQARAASNMNQMEDALGYSLKAQRALSAAFGSNVPDRYRWVAAQHEELTSQVKHHK